MLAQVVRSGVVEAQHDGAVAVVDGDGKLITSSGDIDRPYLIRSAAKPFQAMAALEAGAELTPEELAVACASHGGQPIHVAFVRSMLAAGGLDESALRCPPSWPLGESARDRVLAAGHRAPRRVWYNCSGKHAGMLRACVASGWPIDSYLHPEHPLQVAIRDELAAVGGDGLGEPAVDGCGAPIYRFTTRQLASAYALLATADRYRPIRSALERYGPLSAHSELLSGPSRHWGVAAKGGAEGCIGLAVRNRIGVGIKSFDGSNRPLGPVVADVMTQLGAAPGLTRERWLPTFVAPTYGGGKPVGEVESVVTLS